MKSFMQYIAIPRHASYAAKTNKKDKKKSHQAKYVYIVIVFIYLI